LEQKKEEIRQKKVGLFFSPVCVWRNWRDDHV
jgi:hypothetical protein